MNEAVRQFVSPQQNGFTPSFLPENIVLLKLIQVYLDNEDADVADEAFFYFYIWRRPSIDARGTSSSRRYQ
eukprot:2502972-Prymnesium_polylepis.1